MLRYILVGRAIQGRYKGELVIVGTLRKQNLYENIDLAEGGMQEAVNYMGQLNDPEVDPATITICEVHVPSMPWATINL